MRFILVAVIATMAMVLAILLTAPAGAQQPAGSGADLTGSWDLEFVGAAACTAALTQTGLDIAVTLECEGFPPSHLVGAVNGQDFVLSGLVRGLEGELVASASHDGNALVGGWQLTNAGPPRTVLGVRRTDRVGPFNLTGQWTAGLTGAFPLTCNSAIQQRGNELRIVADCGVVYPLLLTGAGDPASGVFRVSTSGDQLTVLHGVVTGDGSVSGAWFTSFGGLNLSGTLASRRTSDKPQLVNLAGGWDMHLDGRLVGDCTAYIQHPSGDLQAFEKVTASIDCGAGLTGSLRGGVSQPRGQFNLNGLVGTMQFEFRGQRSSSDTLDGVWSAASPRQSTGKSADLEDQFANFGCFVARRVGSDAPLTCRPPAHHPNISVDCFGVCPTSKPPPPGRPLSAVAAADAPDNDGLLFGAMAGMVVEVSAIGFWAFKSHRS